jgi:hypothetical protein
MIREDGEGELIERDGMLRLGLSLVVVDMGQARA